VGTDLIFLVGKVKNPLQEAYDYTFSGPLGGLKT
jgi:hypothetical protein